MIVIMVDYPVEQRNELRVTLPREAALKYGKLQPVSEPLHDPEDPAPALRVRDVVCDEIKVLGRHAQRVVKLGYSGNSPSR